MTSAFNEFGNLVTNKKTPKGGGGGAIVLLMLLVVGGLAAFIMLKKKSGSEKVDETPLPPIKIDKKEIARKRAKIAKSKRITAARERTDARAAAATATRQAALTQQEIDRQISEGVENLKGFNAGTAGQYTAFFTYAPQTKTSYDTITNTDSRAKGTVSGKTIETCSKDCYEDLKCAGFVRDTNTGSCTFKKYTGDDKWQDSTGHNTYMRDSIAYDENTIFGMVHGRKRTSGVKETTAMDDPTLCVGVCAADNECTGFTFDYIRKECKTHTGSFNQNSAIKSNNTNFFYKI